MNILILGGNGYLGSKIVKSLLKEGHSVTCTRRATSNISRVQEDEVNWITASIDDIETEIQSGEFDWIVNTVGNYGRGTTLFDNVLEANIEFPLKVLDKGAEYNVKNYLTIGTSLPDDFNMYSFSKSLFSDFGRYYVEKCGINFYNLKLEMFYGSDEPGDRFIPSMIHKMLQGQEVDTTIGTQCRDIIWVEDAVRAVTIVMKANPPGYHDISVGTGVAPTISEIVDYLQQEIGSYSKINRGTVPMRNNEPDCVADISYLRTLGDWNPMDWKNGMLKMIHEIQLSIKQKEGVI